LGLGIIWAFLPSREVSRVTEPPQASSHRWFRLLAVVGIALPILQVFSITMTANHFFLDAAAGGVVAVAGIGVAVALQRWAYPVGARLVRRLPVAGTGRPSLPEETLAEQAEVARWR